MEHVIELLEGMTGTLSETIKSDIVFGKEVDLGAAKIVPLSRVSIGFGGGGGEGEGDQNFCHPKNRKDNPPGGKGTGGGGGGGLKIRPVGVIVFTENDVKVEKIADKKGLFDKIFERIPDIIDLAKEHTGKA